MTDASNTTDRPTITPAEALEELFGPMAPEPVRGPSLVQATAPQYGTLPVRTPGRAQKIAAIHALAEWFASHPDVPMPNALLATYYVTPDDEPDDGVRLRDYRAVREVLDGRSYPIDNIGKLDRNFQFDHCPPMYTRDMRVTYRAAYVPRERDAWNR
jgi:hypothetical protein